jgi:hypothetical protein
LLHDPAYALRFMFPTRPMVRHILAESGPFVKSCLQVRDPHNLNSFVIVQNCGTCGKVWA